MDTMRTLILSTAALIALAAVPAVGQNIPGSGGISQLGGMSGAANNPGGFGGSAPVKGRANQLAPDAVPGARARPDTVVPLKGGTSDLAPTEALFDAINRGDILTARDALNRGADLDSTNLLGLTPIELSVDLGRNDISFLLLSMRGAQGSNQASRQPAAPAGGAASPPAKMTAAERREAAKAARLAAASSAAPANTPVARASARTPTLFAGNGGAPIPAAGFLGFDRH
jgi:hypothetical protein